MAKGKMMPDNIPITSNQTVRIAELASVVARNATYNALENVLLDKETAQEKIIAKGGEFQELLLPGMALLVAEVLNKLAGRKHPCAELLERYFHEVFGYTLDLTGVVFPEKEGFATYMAVPSDLDEDQIFSRITTYFKVGQYAYQSPVVSNINRDVEQKRPQGLYVFSHRGGDEPDAEYRNKSYDDATEMGMTFMSSKEYLLATGFHHWVNKDHFMDVNGWTRTSSLWSGGRLVLGGWDPSDGDLYLSYGFRGFRRPDSGPRELVLAT